VTDTAAAPTYQLKRILRVRDGMAVTVGMVIGAGILGTPGLIAGYLGDPWIILGMWFFGGVMAGLSTRIVLLGCIPNSRREI
jgi:amino acid transporter